MKRCMQLWDHPWSYGWRNLQVPPRSYRSNTVSECNLYEYVTSKFVVKSQITLPGAHSRTLTLLLRGRARLVISPY